MISTSISTNSITVVITDGGSNKVYTLARSHPNYDAVLEAVRSGDECDDDCYEETSDDVLEAALQDGYDTGYDDATGFDGIDLTVNWEYFDEELVELNEYEQYWKAGYQRGYDKGVAHRANDE